MTWPLSAYNHMPNKYQQFEQNAAYNKDRLVFEVAMSDMNNIYGTPMMYYVVSHDETYDPLFGEDDDRKIERRFPIKAVFELPKELDQLAKFGIEGLDNFVMYVSKQHFQHASQYATSGHQLYPVTSAAGTSATYGTYIPRSGDILRSEYNNKYYEILDIGEQDEMFLQREHSYTLTVRTVVYEHIGLSATTSAAMTELISAVNRPDRLDHSDYISSADDDVLYVPESGESSTTIDPLSGW